MDYKKLLPKRPKDSHKGTFGKILNIAGSAQYSGAAYLSSIAALKIGAGYMTLACPKEITPQITSKTPDITFLPLPERPLEKYKTIEENLHKFDVIALGCGLGQEPTIRFFVQKILHLLSQNTMPVIIDADGLNIIAKLKIKTLPQNCIITPHEAEMARLLEHNLEFVHQNRELCAEEASKKWNCTTVLKGHNTIICSRDGQIHINTSGNSALAKAGSGDVLTGIIAGLLAQGCTNLDAAKLGTYLHGDTGELASKELTEYGVLASDLLAFIPQTIKNL